MITISSHSLILSCIHPATHPLSQDLFKDRSHEESTLSPILHRGRTEERHFEWFAPKMKTGSFHWQSWKYIPHCSSPSHAGPHATPSQPPMVGDVLHCSPGAPGRSRSCDSGQIWDPPGQAARLTLRASDDKRAGSEVCVLQQNQQCSHPGTAGCSHSGVTSPLLAILRYCPAFGAGRKIASSTAVPLSAASRLLAQVTNLTGQVTQNANISG